MKVSTTMSKQDWDNSLSKVWKNAENFEEILNFGLEHNFIDSSDIIHASDIYRDPNKEYEEDEVKEAMKSLDIYDLMSIIKDEYSVREIINNLDIDDVFQCIDDSEMLDYLDGTWELDNHDDEVRTQYYDNVLEDIIDKLEKDYTEYNKNIQNWPSDELHRFICNIVGCTYYDSTVLEQLKEKLNNNNYIENYK